MNQTEAAQMAIMLVGSYPSLNAPFPEIYTKSLRAALMPFPNEIGLPAIEMVVKRCKFPPTVADLTEALEALMQPIRDRGRRIREHEARQKQIADQRSYDDRLKRTPAEYERVRKIVSDLTNKLTPPGTERRRTRPNPNCLHVTDEMREEAFKSLQAGRS